MGQLKIMLIFIRDSIIFLTVDIGIYVDHAHACRAIEENIFFLIYSILQIYQINFLLLSR